MSNRSPFIEKIESTYKRSDLPEFRPGDTIRLEARALDKFIKRQRLFVVHDNVFFNQHGDKVAARVMDARDRRKIIPAQNKAGAK